MKQQKKKRNHWVSQAYLRGFAADSGGKRIWRFGKDQGDPELKRIDRVAYGNWLYVPGGPGQRDYHYEDKLADLESVLFDPGFWKVATSGFLDLKSESIRKGLSLLTAVMWLRTPIHLELMHDLHRKMVEFYGQFEELPGSIDINGTIDEIDTASWPSYRDASEDEVKRMWLAQLGSAGWLAEMFMKMRWAICVAEKPVFITSDNPVITLHKDLRFRGFKNPETSVVFPLSPTRVLYMDNRYSEPDGQYYAENDTAPCLNIHLMRECIAHVFSDRHPDIVCAEMVRKAGEMGFAA